MDVQTIAATHRGCPKCGELSPKDREYCPKCGYHLFNRSMRENRPCLFYMLIFLALTAFPFLMVLLEGLLN
jgi:ribosomal protein S27AE